MAVSGTQDGATPRAPARRWRRRAPVSGHVWLLAPPLLLLSAFFVTPLIAIVAQSFASPAGTFDAYRRMITDGGSLRSVVYTLRVAFTVTVLSLILSYPVAFLIASVRGRWGMVLMALVLVPFWTSAVIRSYAWLVLLQRRGVLNEILLSAGLIERPLRLANTDLGMHLAMVQVMLPFMALPLINVMRGVDPAMLRAASILGANPARQFVSVYLPLTMSGVGAGSALVFVSTLGFYVTPALLGGDGIMTAVLIEQQVSRLLDWPLASALATVLLVSTCLLFLAYERLQLRFGASARAEAAR